MNCKVCGKKLPKDALTCPNCLEELRMNIQIPEISVESPKEKDFIKNDSGKLQWSLMPFEQLEEVVRVLMKGAEKYQRDNWKKCDDINRYKDSLLRHVTAYIEGQKFDSGPGGDNLHHLAHAICNCLFVLYFEKGDIEAWNQWLLEQQIKLEA